MDRLRVLTLNIWNRQGPWEDRLRLIRRDVKALAPDIVGLQEILHHDTLPEDQAQEIARDLGYHVAFAPAWHIGGGLHLGNAVLSRFPIGAADVFPLPVEPDDESRALLYVGIDAPCGRVPVFNTHLTWQLHRGHVRERQVAFIAERVRELAPIGVGFPPIVMGDFNAEPDADEIRYLKGLTSRLGRSVFFADSFAAAGDGSPGFTFARANSFALIAGEPNRRIDYIFSRGPDRDRLGEVLASRVVCTEPENGVWPSDHFGVYAEIRAEGLPKPAPGAQVPG
ncbi:MAG TPA: endonuclease/exonuclease/phosphatase family protein [Polyangia bacterium]|nr:endonuclease/exonuclease/phosphatase family protein [Polyangia bacterium]